ncbi:UDP-glucose 4-epimerase GalE [Lacipirellula sp.]|uniref:UDP-glucose 4-epimerase GalE n=1 Tax=Lacipirellula sp. TaxID=2691419 RepID=UPI003D0B27DC
MKILVTGGAGYVGSHAVRLLTKAGHDVWIFDNLMNGYKAATPAGRLIEGDLLDQNRLAEVFAERQYDAVMHFAALAYVGVSVTDPATYYRNNVVGTLNLLDAMRAAGVNKIVFSSTCATYGTPDKSPITEGMKQDPINPYGYTKLVIERALDDYAHAYGLGFAALRYFNASGAAEDGTIGEDHKPETHLIPLILQVALGQRQEITVFGDDYPTPDGTCVRDYIHVDDLATAHLAALERLQPGKGLKLNLGTGAGASVMEVIDACRRETGHAIPHKMAPRRAGDPAELVADASLARKTLDWTPKYVGIEPIVKSAWKWHKSHPNGYGG